jgi:hypothetical protein
VTVRPWICSGLAYSGVSSARDRLRQGRARPARIGLEQFGDAEVEQLHLPLRTDDDVRGLEVAVHDHVAMGVIDGVADLQEHGEAIARR